MTNLEALISVSQTMLRVRGEWCDNPAFLRDVRNVVADVWTMMRIGDDTIMEPAIRELQRRLPTPVHRIEGTLANFDRYIAGDR